MIPDVRYLTLFEGAFVCDSSEMGVLRLHGNLVSVFGTYSLSGMNGIFNVLLNSRTTAEYDFHKGVLFCISPKESADGLISQLYSVFGGYVNFGNWHSVYCVVRKL